MLPTKKRSDASAGRIPPWHPNFRNYEKLPDIKAVRTVFFVNLAAISLTLLVLGGVGYHEFRIREINAQVAEIEQTIARDKKTSDRFLELYNRFSAEGKKLHEIEAFLAERPMLSPVLVRMAQTLPRNIALSLFDLKAKGLTLRGVVRGAPELASATANAYVEQLRKDPELSAVFDDVALTSLSRDPVSGRLLVELHLRLKPAKPEKK